MASKPAAGSRQSDFAGSAMDASPVTGRADDFEHLLLYICLLFRSLFPTRQRDGRVHILQFGRRAHFGVDTYLAGGGAMSTGRRCKRIPCRSEPRMRAGTARARPSPVTLHPITRMPTHMCARFSPLQGSFAIWRARTAATKGCLLAYASSCAVCRAARRAPPPLRGARSRTGGRTVGRSRLSWKM